MSEIANQLICGDNAEELAKLPRPSVDLIYLDPPFFTNKLYEAPGEKAERAGFSDRWDGLDHYLDWLALRVKLLREVLKPEGSFYLHCDWHANAHLRLLLDEIWGQQNFRNEIVWHYRKWSAGSRQFQRNHDVIFFYAKTEGRRRVFNRIYMPRAASTQKRFGPARIVSGFDADTGKRRPSRTTTADSAGVALDDVWDLGRVPPLQQRFPTQKPEALLARIIQASSHEGDLVLDPFCGSGTTLVAAAKLKRKWIGMDISPAAIKITEARLQELGLTKGEDYAVSEALPPKKMVLPVLR